ncbi:XRE family transcriptional regulator [Streptomyces cyaneofuscatus]|uniref:helix-turn-helix domain-containing protein n=1 Tax=Streptomyces cyaneofuscatus TaxID=66883 RepID=UPI00386CB777|nr:XRE family transcriptional regulator [Streptomyces cyaneofuscatus]
MPRWKALPEELDPQIREFASQLRRLVDRSGLNINAVADRTGFSKTSWERYLNGRLLPPRRAVIALADVTGTPQHHLTTMWELAERAWSRAEMRHDMTIEAIRITQAREALGAADPAGGGRTGPGRSAGGRHSAAGSAGRGSTATGTGGGHGPDGYGPDADRQAGHGSDAYGSDPHRTDPHRTDPHHPDGRAPFVPTQRGTVPPVPQQRQGGRRADTQRGGASGRSTGGRGKAIKLAVGAAGAVIVVVGAVMLAPSGDEPAKATPPPAAPTATPTTDPTTAPATDEPAPEPPAGVECQGADCAGQNPDEMGCGGDHARTVSTAQVGAARVEVRFSEVCSAAWARLTEAGAGDTVTITGGGAADAQNGAVTVTEAYTPMVAVKKAADAKACATLTAGTKGCTT